MEKYKRKVLSFARRIGKPLKINQKQLIEYYLPKYAFNLEEIKQYKNIILEIGFGSGEHIFNKALNNSESLFIGCEPYLNGVTKLLALIKQNNIANIRIWDNDVLDLLPILPEKIFDEVYILFADPWPKLKHHKRRLIKKEFINKFEIYLKEGSKLIIATDHEDYANWIKDQLKQCKNFHLNKKVFPENWIKTKYQKKAELSGIESKYFEYLKKDI